MALMQTKLSKGVLKSRVPRDCAVKGERSNLSNTSCFQDGGGKGHQDYFSVTKILLKLFGRVGVCFWLSGGFDAALLAWCFLSSMCNSSTHALLWLQRGVKGWASWLST